MCGKGWGYLGEGGVGSLGDAALADGARDRSGLWPCVGGTRGDLLGPEWDAFSVGEWGSEAPFERGGRLGPASRSGTAGGAPR